MKLSSKMPQTLMEGAPKTVVPVNYPLKMVNKGGVLPAYLGGHPLQLNSFASNLGKGPGAPSLSKQAYSGPPKTDPSFAIHNERRLSGWHPGDILYSMGEGLMGYHAPAAPMETLVKTITDNARNIAQGRIHALYHIRRNINDNIKKYKQQVDILKQQLASAEGPNDKAAIQYQLQRASAELNKYNLAYNRTRRLTNLLDEFEAAARLYSGSMTTYTLDKAKKGYLMQLAQQIKKEFGIDAFGLYNHLNLYSKNMDPKTRDNWASQVFSTFATGIFEPQNAGKGPTTREAQSILESSKKTFNVLESRLQQWDRKDIYSSNKEVAENARRNLEYYYNVFREMSSLSDPAKYQELQDRVSRTISENSRYYYDVYRQGTQLESVSPTPVQLPQAPVFKRPDKEDDPAVIATRFNLIASNTKNNLWQLAADTVQQAGGVNREQFLGDVNSTLDATLGSLARDFSYLASIEGANKPETMAEATAVRQRIAKTLGVLGIEVAPGQINSRYVSDENVIRTILDRAAQQVAIQARNNNLGTVADRITRSKDDLINKSISEQKIIDIETKQDLGWKHVTPRSIGASELGEVKSLYEPSATSEEASINIKGEEPNLPVDLDWWRRNAGFYRDDKFRTFERVYKDPVLRSMYRFDSRINHLKQLEQELMGAAQNVQATGGFGARHYQMIKNRYEATRNQLMNEIDRAQKDSFKLDLIRKSLKQQNPDAELDENQVQREFIKYKLAEDWENSLRNAQKARKLLADAGKDTTNFEPENLAKRFKERWMQTFYERGMGQSAEDLSAFEQTLDAVTSGKISTRQYLHLQPPTTQPVPGMRRPAPPYPLPPKPIEEQTQPEQKPEAQTPPAQTGQEPGAGAPSEQAAPGAVTQAPQPQPQTAPSTAPQKPPAQPAPAAPPTAPKTPPAPPVQALQEQKPSTPPASPPPQQPTPAANTVSTQSQAKVLPKTNNQPVKSLSVPPSPLPKTPLLVQNTPQSGQLPKLHKPLPVSNRPSIKLQTPTSIA